MILFESIKLHGSILPNEIKTLSALVKESNSKKF